MMQCYRTLHKMKSYTWNDTWSIQLRKHWTTKGWPDFDSIFEDLSCIFSKDYKRVIRRNTTKQILQNWRRMKQ